MKTITYYHKNSNVKSFERIEFEDGTWNERTFDKRGNILTYKDSKGFSYKYTRDEQGSELAYKNSEGWFKIKGKNATKEEYEAFINNLNRPYAGKKVIIDGVEYELK